MLGPKAMQGKYKKLDYLLTGAEMSLQSDMNDMVQAFQFLVPQDPRH